MKQSKHKASFRELSVKDSNVGRRILSIYFSFKGKQMEHVTKTVKVNERKLMTAMERVEASTYDELDWEETEVNV